MIFPILHIPGLGDGMTIALDAVLHVIISHGLAIGLMTMIILFQTLTWMGKGEHWAKISRSLLGPTVVVITSVGAVTGVGIWFITSILAPEGIGSLIHLFFWPWFIEWGAFTSEVILLLIYYYLWDRLAEKQPGKLAALGWGYVVMAVFSAILISGILGFMLTPDGWPWGQDFDQAYFNPTFAPQVFLRLAAGLAIGSLLLTAWIAWRFKGTAQERGSALRLSGGVFLACVAVAGVSAWVYFSRVPMTYLTHWKFAVATSYMSQLPDFLPTLNAVAVGVLCLAGLVAILRSRTASRILCIPALLLCVFMVMEFERIREFVRGPYLLPGYMYANQVPLVEKLALDEKNENFLPRMRWVNDNGKLPPDMVAGQALFAANCGVCHTNVKGGLNNIGIRVAGRTLDSLNAIIDITENLGPFMTPFTGSESERLLLANYIYMLAAEQGYIKTQQAHTGRAAGEVK
ncbi:MULTISPECIES: c-type cytochrome [Desulfovibrio]|uniref:Cytochrome C oxidase, cbb3-type, subunit III n=2 Tax=Desulfovibrio desulfuricans TaxID=876 RepID=A0AA94HUQ3_DESDE|nr:MULTISPECIES: c-type cytochrome [Desulfovibrio]ATD82154.1 cytochrome C [Desulfovibrio sp. G11]SFW68720.1 Cytochrome C oxidase, cbb3-type, subunit III [Desulfovibrio desulfuricans]SPD34885.1 Cytochrome C like [Desulfovibrio sp. G11]